VIKWFDSPSNWNNGSDNGGSGAGWYLCSYNSDNTVKDMFYNLKGTSGDINSITAGDYTGNYTMFADSSYTFSFTISLSGSSSGGGSTEKGDYTVSGAGTETVNGEYFATGNYINDTYGPIYKHATNEVYLFGNGSNCFFAFEATYSPAYYYTCETYSYDIQTGDWTNAIYPSCGSGATPYPTVTKN
jgi:hypothetical protein